MSITGDVYVLLDVNYLLIVKGFYCICDKSNDFSIPVLHW